MPSVKFYLNRPNKDGRPKTSEVVIYGLFTLDRNNRFFVDPVEKIEPKYWDFIRQSVKTSHRHHIDINNNLSDFKRDLLNLWRANRSQMTFDEFKAMVKTQGTSQKKTVFEAFEKFLNQYEQEKDKTTFYRYKRLFELLKTFDQKRPVNLPTLDLTFYDNFKAFLYSLPNAQYKKFQLVKDQDFYTIQPGKGYPVPLLDNTVYKLISNLKNFLGWCEDRGYVVHQSFKKWTIIKHEPKPISLTMAELTRLENAILPMHLSIARDYLVFECRTGQRISDIKRFDLSQFANNTWTFNRKKGNRIHSKQVSVHFEGYCAPALNILERYNFKMPSISEQKLNQNIKTACKEAGINTMVTQYAYSGSKCIKTEGPKYEWISTHSGRKSFITLGLQFMSPKIVKDLVGISDYKTLKHYEGESESGVIRQQLRSMDDKIKSA